MLPPIVTSAVIPQAPPGRPVRRVTGPLQVVPRAPGSGPRPLAPALPTTLVATDVVAFTGRYRDAAAQLYARQMMYDVLIEAFGITGLSWWDCYREDRGDGALVVAPPGSDPDRFLDPLAHHLHALLRWHAQRSSHDMQLRLRMAVHHGYVYRDAYGVTGHAPTHLFRLMEAPAFKEAVSGAGACLGVIVSDQLYTDATQRGGLINPAAYQRLRLSCKETRTRGWLWLPAETAHLRQDHHAHACRAAVMTAGQENAGPFGIKSFDLCLPLALSGSVRARPTQRSGLGVFG